MKEQARLLLSAYRPGGSDANDPAFAEALALAQRDPQLRAWLEDSQHFDRAISERLRSLDVPPDLRATILAGAKLSRPRHWWQRGQLWAAAAAVVVLAAAIAIMWPASAPELATWQTDSLEILDAVEKAALSLDVENPQLAPLVDWLNTRAGPAPALVPLPLAGKRTFGCKMILSHGRKVSMICFDLGNREAAHLFTTPRAGLRILPPDNHPAFKQLRNWNLASWSSGQQVHMLASDIEEGRFRQLVPDFIAANQAQRGAMMAILIRNP